MFTFYVKDLVENTREFWVVYKMFHAGRRVTFMQADTQVATAVQMMSWQK